MIDLKRTQLLSKLLDLSIERDDQLAARPQLAIGLLEPLESLQASCALTRFKPSETIQSFGIHVFGLLEPFAQRKQR